jgi:hypothetical protein
MFTIDWERRQTQPRQSIKVMATHPGNAIFAFPDVFKSPVFIGVSRALQKQYAV